jgi:CDP-glucose 4,6-dehydratase
VIDLNVYAGKRVFVTGDAGFKGSWLVKRLRELGADVVGYDIKHDHDVRNASLIKSAIRVARPDFVFHLAAQAFVPVGFERPVETFEVNVLGTVNLLEALREAARPCAVVVVTTDKVYGGPLDECSTCGHVETDPLVGCCPYAASKVGAEHVVSAYRTMFSKDGHQIALATGRAGNVIGGGDWGAGRLIPNAVRALASRRPVTLWHADAVRPWQYVEDVIDGYLRLGAALTTRHESFLGAFNFGPDEHYTVQEVVEKVIRVWGCGIWVAKPTTFHEVQELRIDSSKAHDLLGWAPKLNIDEAIEATVRWYLAAAVRGELS